MDILDIYYNIYINDIIIFSESEEEYILYVTEILKRLRKIGL